MLLGSTCYEFENYALFLGLLNALLETTRYVPQLWESIKAQTSGAMSYMRLLLSVGGGLGAIYSKGGDERVVVHVGTAARGTRFRDGDLLRQRIQRYDRQTRVRRRERHGERGGDGGARRRPTARDDDEKKSSSGSAWSFVVHYL